MAVAEPIANHGNKCGLTLHLKWGIKQINSNLEAFTNLGESRKAPCKYRPMKYLLQ